MTGMIDLDLLRSFVSVVDAGSFTRAGERVHRTQSTVSQQIRRLEDSFGLALLNRDANGVTPTEEGERLLSYARRILSLADEARDIVTRPAGHGIVRLGIPEDFATYKLPALLADFAHSHAGLRLDVRCDLSVHLRHDLERGDLDLTLVKSERSQGGGVASWPERLFWVTSAARPLDPACDPVPLAVFRQGCVYRGEAVHALEVAGRAWYFAYTSQNLAGIQAAVSAGLGFGILPAIAILPAHRILGATDGYPAIERTELTLLVATGANRAARLLAELLIDFCGTAAQPEAALAA
jgi:DNA-binding transcriptional LysR family regulator